MKKMPVITAVVLTLTMLLLAPLEANAGGRGGGVGFGGGVRVGGHGFGHGFGHHVFFGRNFLARQHFRSFRDQNNFGLWPWFGAGYDNSDLWPWLWALYDQDYSNGLTPQTVVKPAPTQVTCQHSEQTYKVPSENGGTAQVTILRC